MRPAPHSRAVSYTPARLELITAVGPPLCPHEKIHCQTNIPCEILTKHRFYCIPIYKLSAMFRAAFSYMDNRKTAGKNKEDRDEAFAAIAVTVVLAAGLFTACGGGQGSGGKHGGGLQFLRHGFAPEMAGGGERSGRGARGAAQAPGRAQIIYNASVELESKQFEAARDALLEAAAQGKRLCAGEQRGRQRQSAAPAG